MIGFVFLTAVVNPFLIALLILCFLLVLLLLFQNYKRKIASRKVLALEKQLEKFSKENLEYKSRLNELVKEKTGDLHHELEEREKLIIDRKIALKKAKDANYLKNAFLSNMSHEIRTPLNGIMGFSNLLISELSLMEKSDLFEYALGISESSERLMQLLDNLIDISRVDANDFTVNPIPYNINKSLENIYVVYKGKAQEKHLTINLVPTEIPESKFDTKILERILALIVDNAIKYTDRGFINISSIFKAKEEKLVIRIKDTGIGIDSKFLPELFEAFRQESLGYSKNQQGAGLGLPLAQKLMALIGGEIQVKSKKGEGTVVSLYIPFIQTVGKPVPEFKVEHANTKVTTLNVSDIPRILVVEDDKMNRLVFKKMLDNKSILTLASDGDEALKILEQQIQNNQIFDIILMDINLPAPWDGIGVMKEMKSRFKEINNIPFIAQTAYAMSGDREKMMLAGFDDYISKPIDKSELYHIIENNIKPSV